MPVEELSIDSIPNNAGVAFNLSQTEAGAPAPAMTASTSRAPCSPMSRSS